MTNPKPSNDTQVDVNDVNIEVETVEFPFEMLPPEFGEIYNDIEGVVLNLSDIISQDQDSLILKGQGEGEDPVKLIAPATVIDSGVIAASSSDMSAELSGYHYYTFADEFTLYSEYAVNFIYL